MWVWLKIKKPGVKQVSFSLWFHIPRCHYGKYCKAITMCFYFYVCISIINQADRQLLTCRALAIGNNFSGKSIDLRSSGRDSGHAGGASTGPGFFPMVKVCREGRASALTSRPERGPIALISTTPRKSDQPFGKLLANTHFLLPKFATHLQTTLLAKLASLGGRCPLLVVLVET